MPSICLSYSVDYNNSKFLLIVSDFIIGRLCLGAYLITHEDIVVHRLGVIGHIHIDSVRVKDGIGLKYTQAVHLTFALISKKNHMKFLFKFDNKIFAKYHQQLLL